MRFEAAGVRVLVSTPELVGACKDKNKTTQLFWDCGLKAPEGVSDWKDYRGGYPAFIKPTDGSSSVGAYKVENEEALKIYAGQLEDYIVQPFISGTEYTVDVFADFEGHPIYITPRERLSVRAGEVQKSRVTMDRQIIRACRRMVEKYKPCGPITVQLIRDRDGNDHYIEINPRFGGGSPLSMKAGARSAEALLHLLDGEEVARRQVTDGIIFSRFDQSVWVSRKEPSPVKGVIFDLDDTLYAEKEYIWSGYQAVASYLGEADIAGRLWEHFINKRQAIDEVLAELHGLRGRQKESGVSDSNRMDVLQKEFGAPKSNGVDVLQKEDELQECIRIYREHKPRLHLYDGAEQLIRNLKRQGIKVGIITDGRPAGQRNKIRALGLEGLVDDIIVTDELGGVQFRKPCDISFRIMARRWKIHYENIVYIADNAGKDFLALRQLGMQGIWYRNFDGLYGADNIECSFMAVRGIKELTEKLLKNKQIFMETVKYENMADKPLCD